MEGSLQGILRALVIADALTGLLKQLNWARREHRHKTTVCRGVDATIALNGRDVMHSISGGALRHAQAQTRLWSFLGLIRRAEARGRARRTKWRVVAAGGAMEEREGAE